MKSTLMFHFQSLISHFFSIYVFDVRGSDFPLSKGFTSQEPPVPPWCAGYRPVRLPKCPPRQSGSHSPNHLSSIENASETHEKSHVSEIIPVSSIKFHRVVNGNIECCWAEALLAWFTGTFTKKKNYIWWGKPPWFPVKTFPRKPLQRPIQRPSPVAGAGCPLWRRDHSRCSFASEARDFWVAWG